MSETVKLREPTCHQCPHRFLYEGRLPMKKYGINMKPYEVFCTFEKRARRFQKRDPQVRVPQWCPKRLKTRKLRVYGFQDAGMWLLHERLCRDLGKDLSPEGRHYAVEHEADTDLTAKEFLERSSIESDTELLGGVTVAVHQVVEIDDGLRPAFFYKTENGYRYEPYFNAAAAQKPSPRKRESGVNG